MKPMTLRWATIESAVRNPPSFTAGRAAWNWAQRRKALIRHFGGVRAVLEADEDALSAVPGIGVAMAQQIHLALHGEDSNSES